MPATLKPPPQRWASYQHETASKAMCGSLATIGMSGAAVPARRRPSCCCRSRRDRRSPGRRPRAGARQSCQASLPSCAADRVRLGRHDRFLIRLAEQELAVERPVAEHALGQLRHDDDREAAGEIPAELALDGQASRAATTARGDSRAGRTRSAVARRTASIQALTPAENASSTVARFVGQARHSSLGDAVQPDGPGDEVQRQAVRPEHLRQPAEPLAAQVVQLEQPVLGHREAEAEPQVVLAARRRCAECPSGRARSSTSACTPARTCPSQRGARLAASRCHQASNWLRDQPLAARRASRSIAPRLAGAAVLAIPSAPHMTSTVTVSPIA